MTVNSSSIKVSVLITTYNQERYIAQAIDSVLMQEVNFDYEVVVGEDASTDKTRDIVLDYENQHPDRVRVLLHDKVDAELDRSRGLGGKMNLVDALRSSRGTYIAQLDGDDYWTDSSKLQKQIDFLDTHPEYALCCHRGLLVSDAVGSEAMIYPLDTQEEAPGIEDLLRENFILSSSVVFRRGLFGELPAWFYGLATGDWALHVLNAEHGRIGYLKEVMSVYRIHSDAFWTTKGSELQSRAMISFYETINEHLGFRYNRVIAPRVFMHWYELAVQVVRNGNYAGAKAYGKHCFFARPFHRNLFLRAKLLLRLYAPPIYKCFNRVRSSARVDSFVPSHKGN